MSNNYIKYSISAGLATFALCLFILLAINSPFPYLGAIVVGFIIFEMSFYHLFGKEKEKQKLM
ncbi:hypothetical protein [Thalassobacillus pellis]|uniref:hypothetical protein n=1 Tax=Thalassobacillus pellis TaxID=748008 RepID=UPI001960792E|nr:hypothetical protein [Thalassobacillus pellis]MBM7552169.1 hypothetical protein [Thalassobacillus pellis]